MECTKQQNSEVARLLAQIQEEYESAVLGIKGFAYGAAQHQVINQKMTNIYLWQEELETLVGEDAAITLVDQELRACASANPIFFANERNTLL